MVDADDLKRPRMVAVIFLSLGAALALCSMWSLAMDWPYSGHFGIFGLLLTLPIVLFQSFRLFFMWRWHKPLRGWRGWVARLLAIILGFVLAPFNFLEGRSMARFEQKMAPLVAQIRSKLPTPCTPQATYIPGDELSDYLMQSRRGSGSATLKGVLHYDRERFVFSVFGTSLDIDGSTIYFDSASGVWKKFHNDHRDAAQKLEKLTETMSQCPLLLP